jgi:hypothetical protein
MDFALTASQEGAGLAEVVLRLVEMMNLGNSKSSFRGASKMRTRNLEIPGLRLRSAIADRKAHPGMTSLREAVSS